MSDIEHILKAKASLYFLEGKVEDCKRFTLSEIKGVDDKIQEIKEEFWEKFMWVII